MTCNLAFSPSSCTSDNCGATPNSGFALHPPGGDSSSPVVLQKEEEEECKTLTGVGPGFGSQLEKGPSQEDRGCANGGVVLDLNPSDLLDHPVLASFET